VSRHAVTSSAPITSVPAPSRRARFSIIITRVSSKAQ
jgi:hypothetical protein